MFANALGDDFDDSLPFEDVSTDGTQDKEGASCSSDGSNTTTELTAAAEPAMKVFPDVMQKDQPKQVKSSREMSYISLRRSLLKTECLGRFGNPPSSK